MKEYNLIDGEYLTKEQALVEVTETLEAPVIKQSVSVYNLNKTIAALEDKKAKYTAAVDEEIAINQAMLVDVTALSDTAIIKEVIDIPAKEATSTLEIIK